MTVKFIMKSPQMVLDFVKFTNEFVDYVEVKSRNKIIDGKSIMGLLSIDLPSEVEVVFHSDNSIALRLFDAYMTKLLEDYGEQDD